MFFSEGVVLSLNVSEAKGVKKRPVAEARFVAGEGIAGDAHAALGERQVSLLAEESIARMRAKGVEVGPGDFAENITTRGVTLWGLAVGSVLTVGQVKLRITRIGKECRSPCAIFRAVGDCVMPREGVFAEVLTGGVVGVGQGITVEEKAKG